MGDLTFNKTRKHYRETVRSTFLRAMFRDFEEVPSLYEFLNNNTDEVVKTLVEDAICADYFVVEGVYEEFDFTKGIMFHMKNNTLKSWFETQSASWDQKFSPEFSEVFTRRGMAFSFNMVEASKLLNLDE